MKWRNPYAQKTAFDENIQDSNQLIKVMFSLLNTYDSRTKAIKRQKGKGMADAIQDFDTHIVDRETHMKQTANLAAIMAARLGLNVIIPTLGMYGHDIGHFVYSHEGEVILSTIGVLLKVGYFNHPAKGIEVMNSENFIDKLVDAFIYSIDDPLKREQIRNDDAYMKRLKSDAWYILDVIVSHDGEATSKEIKQQLEEKRDSVKQSPKDAVREKTSKSNSFNLSKNAPETLEAALAKPADVISYLKTDLENAFRKEIMDDFNDDFLECVGALLFEKEGVEKTQEEKIKETKEHIKKVKKDCLRETKEDVYNVYNEEILKEVSNTIQELDEYGIKEYSPESNLKEAKIAEKIINKHKNKYIGKISNNASLDDIASEKHKFTDFVHKMLKVRNTAVEILSEEVKQALIDDYCKNTNEQFEKIINDATIKDEDKKLEMMKVMDFSPKVSKIVQKLKKINYRDYVQHAKKEYQTNVMPKEMYKAIKACSNALVRTGVIRDKCYDKGIIDLIKDEKVKEAMKYAGTYKRIANYDGKKEFNKKEKKIKKFKRKIGINEFNYNEVNGKRAYLKRKSLTARNLLYKDIYANTQRMGERFAIVCEDVYNAIPNTIRELVGKALSSSYKENHYLPKEEKREINKIKNEIIKRGVTPDSLEEYINYKINYERTVNFAQNIANALAIKYIGRIWR